MIQAIETSYNGYRFRSRLEARWAVFFDMLGESYQFEHEGFAFWADGKQLRYLPDFWLPRFNRWLEIKGDFDQHDAELVKGFVDALMDFKNRSRMDVSFSLLTSIDRKLFETFDTPGEHKIRWDVQRSRLGMTSRPELWAECPLCNRLAVTCACEGCASSGYWWLHCPYC